MSGVLSTTDVLCGGVPSTPIPRGSIIPNIAQAYALALFQFDFETRYPGNPVFSELEIFKTRTGKSLIDVVLDQLSSDFRNYYAQTTKNRKLIAAGKIAEQLKEGRQRKADGLGIAVDPLRRAIICELMEVTTANQAESTIKEDLIPKLAILRGPVKTFIDEKLARLSGSQSLLPQKFIASGTPWIIPPELCIVPIFPEGGLREPASSTYRWICFAPTYKYRPMGVASPFITNVEPDESPAKGLILYSLHQVNSGTPVTSEVLKKLREWTAQRIKQQNLGLQLLPVPEITRYWQDNRSDLNQFLGWVALGSIAVAVVALAIYFAPVVVPTATSLLFNLAAAEGEALLAPAVIASLARSLPPLLQLSRTMVNTAINVGGVSAYGYR